VTQRLQVLLEESEMRDLRRAARARKMTVAEWVRQALRAARRQEPEGDAGAKLAAIRSAARHGFPTADVDQILADIERGYASRTTP
jgi:hypothetical protein